MNFNASLLIICLAASELITPAQKALGQNTQHQINAEVQHLECVKEAQYLKCEVNDTGARQVSTQTQNSESLNFVVKQDDASQHNLITQVNQYWSTNSLVGTLFIIFVCGASLSLFLYKKHHNHRAAVLRQNIEMLERLWRINHLQ